MGLHDGGGRRGGGKWWDRGRQESELFIWTRWLPVEADTQPAASSLHPVVTHISFQKIYIIKKITSHVLMRDPFSLCMTLTIELLPLVILIVSALVPSHPSNSSVSLF